MSLNNCVPISSKLILVALGISQKRFIVSQQIFILFWQIILFHFCSRWSWQPEFSLYCKWPITSSTLEQLKGELSEWAGHVCCLRLLCHQYPPPRSLAVAVRLLMTGSAIPRCKDQHPNWDYPWNPSSSDAARNMPFWCHETQWCRKGRRALKTSTYWCAGARCGNPSIIIGFSL